MKNEIALKYLLLRHIKAFDGKVPFAVFEEVVESLRVVADAETYTVYWRIGGKAKTKQIPKKDFIFFHRGDLISDSSIDQDLSTNNDILARSFAEEALNISVFQLQEGKAGTRMDLLVDIADYLLFIIILLLFGISYPIGIILLAILLSEYLNNGRILTSLLFIILAFFSYGATMAGALVYSILQFFDPNPVQRKMRIALSLIAFAVALSIAWSRRPDYNLNIYFIILMLCAFFIAGFRSLLSFSYRIMPLVLPFVCAGLTLENKIAPALIGMGFYFFLVFKLAYFSRFNTKSERVFL